METDLEIKKKSQEKRKKNCKRRVHFTLDHFYFQFVADFLKALYFAAWDDTEVLEARVDGGTCFGRGRRSMFEHYFFTRAQFRSCFGLSKFP